LLFPIFARFSRVCGLSFPFFELSDSFKPTAQPIKMRMANVAFVLEQAYYNRRSNIYLSRKCLNSRSALEVPTIHKWSVIR